MSKKGKTAKIYSREMGILKFFFRPRKLVPAKISSLKISRILPLKFLFTFDTDTFFSFDQLIIERSDEDQCEGEHGQHHTSTTKPIQCIC